jgi:DNA-binding beta-propeller fold protein YncE
VAGKGTPEFFGDGGPANHCGLNYPFGVALDSAGNIYIADTFNHRIRMIAATTE